MGWERHRLHGALRAIVRTAVLKEVRGHWKVLYREMTGSDLGFKRITWAVGLRIGRKG